MAFDTVGQTRVSAQTMAVNTGFQAVMKTVGMRHVRAYFRPGTWVMPDGSAEDMIVRSP